MTQLPTDKDKHVSTTQDDEVTGVFKSGELPIHRLNSGTNSAVSDVAVDRAAEDPRNTGFEAPDALTPITRGAISTEGIEPKGAGTVEEALDSLEASVAKADALVQSVEQRQSQIDEAYQKAEAMLAEVNRIAAAMTFSDSLRERVNATVARTRRLRGQSGK